MRYPDCYGKMALGKPKAMKEKGCIECPHWNGCLSVTRITEGNGVEVGKEGKEDDWAIEHASGWQPDGQGGNCRQAAEIV